MNKPPKINIDAVARLANKIASDRFYKGARQVTKLAKMQSGVNHGKKSFYGAWESYEIGPYTSVLENPTAQASAFQNGMSTVAIQVIRHVKKTEQHIYVGWRTSHDEPGKKNVALTRWAEKYFPGATEVNPNGKAKTFHINVPYNKFKIREAAVTQLISSYLPWIRGRIARGIKDELQNNKQKYLK
jgi:hypothetical protein